LIRGFGMSRAGIRHLGWIRGRAGAGADGAGALGRGSVEGWLAGASLIAS
jgi:hypothetical protein